MRRNTGFCRGLFRHFSEKTRRRRHISAAPFMIDAGGKPAFSVLSACSNGVWPHGWGEEGLHRCGCLRWRRRVSKRRRKDLAGGGKKAKHAQNRHLSPEQVKIIRHKLALFSRIRMFWQSEPLTAKGVGDKIISLRFEAICPEVRQNFELYGGKNQCTIFLSH